MPSRRRRRSSTAPRRPRFIRRFERVAALVEGVESSFGLALLALMHWVLKQESPRSHDELVARIDGWNNHKKRFSPRQIVLAADAMAEKG